MNNKKTCLEIFCKCLGWKGGTIHQAKQRFEIASINEMDSICGYLVDNISIISDLETLQYFTQKRLEANNLTIRAMK